MRLPDPNFLPLDRPDLVTTAPRLVATPDTEVVTRLLHKLESDVKAVMARGPVGAGTIGAGPSLESTSDTRGNPIISDQDQQQDQSQDQDDTQPLPRMFMAPSSDDPSNAQLDTRETYAEYKFAAFRGFCAGLVLVLPAIVWISFALLPAPADTPANSRVQIASAEMAAVPKLLAPPRQQVDPAAALATSAGLIREGQVRQARDLLSAEQISTLPAVAMALAETFDPNMLAAWNALDVEPDVAKARTLYGQAADGGIAGATRRLAALR